MRLKRWLLPAWTASRSDLQWPHSYLLILFVTTSPLAIRALTHYMAANDPSRLSQIIIILLLYGVVTPELAFRERTVILFDGVRLSLQIVILTISLIALLYGFTNGGFSSTLEIINRFLFAIAICGSYGFVVLGFIWAIQSARNSTKGVRRP